jgi:hypothetical protein
VLMPLEQFLHYQPLDILAAIVDVPRYTSSRRGDGESKESDSARVRSLSTHRMADCFLVSTLRFQAAKACDLTKMQACQADIQRCSKPWSFQ